jgi:hypothetical protein
MNDELVVDRTRKLPTSDNEPTSSNRLRQQLADEWHFMTSQSRSPFHLPPFSSFDMSNTSSNDKDESRLNSGQTMSLTSMSSFDALMNSLKTIREKTLDYAVRCNDDQRITVAE